MKQRPCAIASLLLPLLCGSFGALAHAGTVYSTLDLSSIVNSDVTWYTNGTAYPSPGILPVSGIPFLMTDGGNGNTWLAGGLSSQAATYSITGLSLSGVTAMYFMVNSAWGNCGSTIGSLKVSTATSSSTVNIVEGTNSRDHYNGGYCNSETQSVATWNSAWGSVRFDVYQLNLATLTSGGARPITAIQFTNLGYGANYGSPLLAAVTFATALDHFAVSAPATALNCEPASVTVSAHTASHAVATVIDTVTLSTSTGHGDWTLSSGSGTFSAGASNSGAATYAFSTLDNGTATFALRDTYAETLTIGVTDGTVTARSGSALASEDPAVTFVASGFRFTTGANVATTIGTQRAGLTSTQALALQAVRTDTNTGACTTAFASGQSANISVAYQCNNPGSCVAGQSFTLTSNGASKSIAGNPASAVSTYTTVPMKFSTANAEAPFTISYSDAGQVTLYFRYAIPLGNGSSSSNVMTGSGQFVVQPYTLALSNIKRTSDSFANPGASTAAGTVFIGAGQPFTATVTAKNYQGTATPNFGQETSPATVTLSPSLVLPASGHNPALSGSFGSYISGAATGTAFSWPEAGIITMTPSVGSYLGSGTVAGTTSGNVGRFVPNAFATALNTPVFATGCAAGNFTYVGQPFTYAVAPAITVTAQALGGATTQNYTGSLMRLNNTSLTGRTYTPTPVTPALTLSGLPATTADPVVADLGSGQVSLTFSAGSGLSFTRGSALAPFAANISLSENVIDLDGVSAANPVTFGAGSGIAFSSGASQYYGRLAVADAVGSELLDLPVALTAQYYVSGTAGFATNTNDSCTSAPTISFSNFQQNLTAGAVCVRDSGQPGASGAGCAAAAANRYDSTAVNGNFNLILSAPGSGHYGAVSVTASVPAWLQYSWNAGSGSNSNPLGLATFGAFSGTGRRVHQREVY